MLTKEQQDYVNVKYMPKPVVLGVLTVTIIFSVIVGFSLGVVAERENQKNGAYYRKALHTEKWECDVCKGTGKIGFEDYTNKCPYSDCEEHHGTCGNCQGKGWVRMKLKRVHENTTLIELPENCDYTIISKEHK